MSTTYEVRYRNGQYGFWNVLCVLKEKEKALEKIDEDSLINENRSYKLFTESEEVIIPTKLKLNSSLYTTPNTIWLVLYKTGFNRELEVADQFPSKEAAELYIKNTPFMFPIIRKVVIE